MKTTFFQKFFRDAAGLATGLFLFISAALAQAGYDAFTREMAYAPKNSTAKNIAANFLTYPFEIARWPLNKTLTFIEEKRIAAKTKHVLIELHDHGVDPRFNFSAWGSDFDLLKLSGLENKLPSNLIAQSWVVYGHENIFDTGAKFGAKSIGPTGFHGFGNVRYNNRSEEDFYGLGPNTSEGDEVSYEMETTTLEAVTGYNFEYALGLDAKIGYRNINISATEDDDDPLIHEKNFSDRRVPGLHGEQLLTLGTEFHWEPASSEKFSATPGSARVGVDFNEGLDDNARYFKFLLDFKRNFEMGSPLRILGFHFYGEHNNELPGHDVPFHQMARLGGFGNYPSQSHTMRSYDDDRFYDNNAALFNVEYRYQIYEYREWSLAHVIFLDQGQAFQRMGKFKFNDFRESYGLGLRLYHMHRVFFDVSFAHGDEGTSFHFKNRQPF